MNKLKVIDLFAGCGGLSLGFKQSNYDICASIEIENAFCKTLQANADKKELILNFDITECNATWIGCRVCGIISIAIMIKNIISLFFGFLNFILNNFNLSIGTKIIL